jgi:catechol 2,3-dioxygenase-like lactoylglutathione lyase family enzyme
MAAVAPAAGKTARRIRESRMKLAKPRFDAGLYTNNLEPMLAFWQGEVGAAFDGLNPMGPGRVQHRHLLGGCTFKINHYASPLAPAPARGYREVLVAREGLTAPRSLTDPDGNRVTLVPPGRFGIGELGVRVAANDPAAHRRFYEEALGFAPAEGGCRLGGCVVLVDPAAAPVAEAPMNAKGYRYLTLGVVDAEQAHAEALAAGAREGAPVRAFGETVRFSLLRDPDGNWVELTQH